MPRLLARPLTANSCHGAFGSCVEIVGGDQDPGVDECLIAHAAAPAAPAARRVSVRYRQRSLPRTGIRLSVSDQPFCQQVAHGSAALCRQHAGLAQHILLKSDGKCSDGSLQIACDARHARARVLVAWLDRNGVSLFLSVIITEKGAGEGDNCASRNGSREFRNGACGACVGGLRLTLRHPAPGAGVSRRRRASSESASPPRSSRAPPEP